MVQTLPLEEPFIFAVCNKLKCRSFRSIAIITISVFKKSSIIILVFGTIRMSPRSITTHTVLYNNIAVTKNEKVSIFSSQWPPLLAHNILHDTLYSPFVKFEVLVRRLDLDEDYDNMPLNNRLSSYPQSMDRVLCFLRCMWQ